jgi:hypothetical protein
LAVPLKHFGYLASKDFQFILFPNLEALNVPDEGNFRNASQEVRYLRLYSYYWVNIPECIIRQISAQAWFIRYIYD